MPSTALAQLESLLTTRKLDHTLASQRKAPALSSELPSGWNEPGPALECPGGQISEIVGPRSSGRQTVLVSCLAAATQRGELTALVDPLDMFDPSSAAARGVDLSRLLWVRGRALLGPDAVSLPRETGDLRMQIERAVKALNLILQAGGPQRGSRAGVEAGGFGLVALDLGEVPMPVIGRLPFTTWRRLHRVIEGSETACVVVASEPLARSVAGITLVLDGIFNAEGAAPAAAAERLVREAAVSVGGAPTCSATSALKNGPRHVRLLPALKIEGRAVHARGMRTAHFAVSFDAEDAEDRRGRSTF